MSCRQAALATTPAATEIAAPFDTAHFRQRRPSTAERTVTFAPGAIDRGSPASVARLKERDGQQGDDGLEPRRIGTDRGGGTGKALRVVAETQSEQIRDIHAGTDRAFHGDHLGGPAATTDPEQPVQHAANRILVHDQRGSGEERNLAALSIDVGRNEGIPPGIGRFPENFFDHRKPRLPLRMPARELRQARLDRGHRRLS